MKLAGFEVGERFYEIGSPAGLAELDELLAQGGRYAQMWALQQQEKNATEQAAITDPLAFAG